MTKLLRIISMVWVIMIVFSVEAQELDLTQWEITGSGWLQNRKLTRQLRAILPTDEKLDANDIEDSAVIILSLMQQKGYLDAEVVTHLEGRTKDSSRKHVKLDILWDRSMETYLKQDLSLDGAVFEVHPGPVFFYKSLQLLESHGLDEALVRSFFFKEPMLFQSDRIKLFNESQFQKGCRNIEHYLAQSGYQNAIVLGNVLSQDWKTGEVEASVSVNKGKLHTLETVTFVQKVAPFAEEISFDPWLGGAYSREIRQDILKLVRNAYYAEGYPDVVVDSRLQSETIENSVLYDLELSIEEGGKAEIGMISIEGLELTHESFVRKKLDLQTGDPLNPILLDRNRLALSQTGLFEGVRVALDREGEERDLTFMLEERFPWTLDFILGWGSYEQLRLGSTARRDNLWGQAHQAVLKGVVSFKSLSGDAMYTIPDIRRSGVNASGRAFYLKREENSFDREEKGVDVGLSKRFEKVRLDATVVYTLEVLQSIDRQSRELIPDEDSRVGSFGLRLTRDMRDSPITPQEGYRLNSNFEWANQNLGGNVNYLLGELGFSFHKGIGNGLFVHFGLSSGIVSSSDSEANYIPTNKLYFPGGDDSIRGFQRGEAAPRDEDGFFIGARSFSLVNLELEQSITETISAVMFYDWVGTSPQSGFQGYGESLQSIGFGLRWKTVIGPVRLEYGHNLNPRELDPSGTFHLAIGFPF